jgi:hypothetical protein
MIARDQIQLWLAQRLPLPGILAGGMALPDRTVVTCAIDPRYPPAALDNALRCAADAFDVAALHRFQAQRSRWLFDQVEVHCARRSDKHLLAVFVDRRDSDAGPRGLDALFEEFHHL